MASNHKKSFLELVADSLLSSTAKGDNRSVNLHNTIVVFPNKRASLFLNDYLVKNKGDVMWAPQYMSISEFFDFLAKKGKKKIKKIGRTEAIVRLYNNYKQLYHCELTKCLAEQPHLSEEQKAASTIKSLDEFYGWGERLLLDFDDIDKNMGDAHKIFRNLKDYEETGISGDLLSEEQRAELEHYARNFKDDTKIRVRYALLWRILQPLYDQLRHELTSDGKAYEGQLYRYVAEAYPSIVGTKAYNETVCHTNEDSQMGLDNKVRVAFVGFNVLDKVEKMLFLKLKEQGIATFYWDYDTYYVKQLSNNKYVKACSEAGTFLAENLNLLGNDLKGCEAHFNNLLNRKPGSITFAQADTDAIQAQYAAQWLKDEQQEHFDNTHARETAIVLSDEKMLQPLLHALPYGEEQTDVKCVNITKGFPLNFTSAYAIINNEIDKLLHGEALPLTSSHEMLRLKFTTCPTIKEATQVLNALINLAKQHMWLPETEDEADEMEDKAEVYQTDTHEEKWIKILHNESYYQVYVKLTEFKDIINKTHLFEDSENHSMLNINYTMLFKLMRKEMQLTSIPFHGEPAMGLQVMGVLETRCLDFKHVLMLSVGEGILPQRSSEDSFIPFIIRTAYGLTTYLRKTAVFAYYFYRLLQRAETITLVYNDSTQGTRKGEMSRFMRAMLVDSNLSKFIRRVQLVNEPKPHETFCDEFKVKPELIGKNLSRSFSPSALNTYLHCPRMFYYKYVEHIQVPDESGSEVVDPRNLGTIVHKIAEYIFSEYKNRIITPANIRHIIDNVKGKLDKLIIQAFEEEKLEANDFLKHLVKKFVITLLKFEASDKPQVSQFVFKDAEKSIYTTIGVHIKGEEHDVPIRIGGTIDRIDIATFNSATNKELSTGRFLRVIDYKTGGKVDENITLDTLFNQKTDKKGNITQPEHHPKYPFQAFLYCWVISRESPYRTEQIDGICPALYYIHHTTNDEYTPYIKLGDKWCYDFNTFALPFEAKLKQLLEEILSPDNAFACTTQGNKRCKYCDYKALCGNSDIDDNY